MNSGIGPRADLEAIGIPLIHDLPGVGRNLHDQVHVPLTFSINETDKNDLNWASVIEYLQYRTGPLSGIGNNFMVKNKITKFKIFLKIF